MRYLRRRTAIALLLLAVAAEPARGQERGPLHRPRSRHRAADDLQLGRPDTGPGDSQDQLQTRGQSAPVQLGQYADRSDVGRVAIPVPHRRTGTARHDLPARQATNAVLERAERNRWRGGHRGHLFHQRNQLDGRLRGHLRCRGNHPEPGGIRARHERLRRRLRKRPGATGRRHDQSHRENRRPGPAAGEQSGGNGTRPTATNCV